MFLSTLATLAFVFILYPADIVVLELTVATIATIFAVGAVGTTVIVVTVVSVIVLRTVLPSPIVV